MKRGMSAVVTTLIVILLAIVAVGIVWVVVKNVINKEKEEISLSKLTVDLQIEKVLVEDDNLNIIVRRNSGEGNLIGINFVFSDGDDSVVVRKDTTLIELETEIFIFILNELAVGDIISIEIVPILELSSGKESPVSTLKDIVTYDAGDLASGRGAYLEENPFTQGEWNISVDEHRAFANEIMFYNTSQAVLDLINNEFEIVSRDDSLIWPAVITYQNKQGTEEDLLRLVFNILLFHNYNGAYFVYESDSGVNVIFPFRDLILNESRYFYFDNGILNISYAGESFDDLLILEEQRRNILIEEYGIIFERDVLEDYNLTITGVEEWIER